MEMTREEAIEILKKYKTESEEDYYVKRVEALEMAIKALKQQSALDKIRAEIDSYCSDNRDRNDGLYIAMRIIDKYKEESEVGE